MPELWRTRCDNSTVTNSCTHRATVRAVAGWHCPECGDVEFAEQEGVRYAEALEKLRMKVDAEESAELARIRKKLKLSQRSAAAMTMHMDIIIGISWA